MGLFGMDPKRCFWSYVKNAMTLRSQRKAPFFRSESPLALLQEVSYCHVEVKGEALLSENIDLPQGTLDLLILRILSVGRQHGWAISERAQQMSSDVLRIQQGSLYPALHRLERRGLIKAHWGTSENNRRAKYYELSKSGQRQLEVEKNAWAKLTAAVAQVLGTA
jgi:PadR family transcriptional regulator, regulatory protein PadR